MRDVHKPQVLAKWEQFLLVLESWAGGKEAPGTQAVDQGARGRGRQQGEESPTQGNPVGRRRDRI